MELAVGAALAYVGKRLTETKRGTTAQVPSSASLYTPTGAPTMAPPPSSPGATFPARPSDVPTSYLSERNLESYTGGRTVMSAESAPPPAFQPTPDVPSRPIATFEEALERNGDFLNERKVFNNTSATRPTQVGPGLGIGYFETARNTGFHEMFRVMPGNVNVHRRHGEMKGRVIPGGRPVEEGQARSQFRAPKNVEQGAHHPPLAGAYRVHEATQRPLVAPKLRDRVATSYTGIAQANEDGARAGAGETTRHFERAGSSYVGGGISQGHGGYKDSQYITYENQRTLTPAAPVAAGPSAATRSEVIRPQEGATGTQRGFEEQPYPVLGATGTEKNTTSMYLPHSTLSTQRGSSGVVMAGQGTYQRRHVPDMQVPHSQRETMAVGHVGGAGSSGNGQYSRMGEGFQVYAKPDVSHTPHGGRMNLITHGQFGTVAVSEDARASRAPVGNREGMSYATESQSGAVRARVPVTSDTRLFEHASFLREGRPDLQGDLSRKGAFR